MFSERRIDEVLHQFLQGAASSAALAEQLEIQLKNLESVYHDVEQMPADQKVHDALTELESTNELLNSLYDALEEEDEELLEELSGPVLSALESARSAVARLQSDEPEGADDGLPPTIRKLLEQTDRFTRGQTTRSQLLFLLSEIEQHADQVRQLAEERRGTKEVQQTLLELFFQGIEQFEAGLSELRQAVEAFDFERVEQSKDMIIRGTQGIKKVQSWFAGLEGS